MRITEIQLGSFEHVACFILPQKFRIVCKVIKENTVVGLDSEEILGNMMALVTIPSTCEVLEP